MAPLLLLQFAVKLLLATLVAALAVGADGTLLLVVVLTVFELLLVPLEL